MATAAPAFHLTYRLSPEDIKAAWQQATPQLGPDRFMSAANFLTFVLLGLGSALLLAWMGIPSQYHLLFYAGVASSYGLLVVLGRIAWRRRAARMLRAIYASAPAANHDVHFMAGETDIAFEYGRIRWSEKWSGIATVEDSQGYVRLLHESRDGHLIPARAFASEGEKSAFIEFVRGRIAQAAMAEV